MAQQANNTFQGGLVIDENPLAIGGNSLTDAKNATIVSNLGTGYVLQNDMGNTKLKYRLDDGSENWEDVKLNDGFIPLGIKEYGNVLYIVSYNPKTEEAEIGSFPSPERRSSNRQEDLDKQKYEMYFENKLYPSSAILVESNKNYKTITQNAPSGDFILYKYYDPKTSQVPFLRETMYPCDNIDNYSFEGLNPFLFSTEDENVENGEDRRLYKYSIQNYLYGDDITSNCKNLNIANGLIAIAYQCDYDEILESEIKIVLQKKAEEKKVDFEIVLILGSDGNDFLRLNDEILTFSSQTNKTYEDIKKNGNVISDDTIYMSHTKDENIKKIYLQKYYNGNKEKHYYALMIPLLYEYQNTKTSTGLNDYSKPKLFETYKINSISINKVTLENNKLSNEMSEFMELSIPNDRPFYFPNSKEAELAMNIQVENIDDLKVADADRGIVPVPENNKMAAGTEFIQYIIDVLALNGKFSYGIKNDEKYTYSDNTTDEVVFRYEDKEIIHRERNLNIPLYNNDQLVLEIGGYSAGCMCCCDDKLGLINYKVDINKTSGLKNIEYLLIKTTNGQDSVKHSQAIGHKNKLQKAIYCRDYYDTQNKLHIDIGGDKSSRSYIGFNSVKLTESYQNNALNVIKLELGSIYIKQNSWVKTSTENIEAYYEVINNNTGKVFMSGKLKVENTKYASQSNYYSGYSLYELKVLDSTKTEIDDLYVNYITISSSGDQSLILKTTERDVDLVKVFNNLENEYKNGTYLGPNLEEIDKITDSSTSTYAKLASVGGNIILPGGVIRPGSDFINPTDVIESIKLSNGSPYDFYKIKTNAKNYFKNKFNNFIKLGNLNNEGKIQRLDIISNIDPKNTTVRVTVYLKKHSEYDIQLLPEKYVKEYDLSMCNNFWDGKEVTDKFTVDYTLFGYLNFIGKTYNGTIGNVFSNRNLTSTNDTNDINGTGLKDGTVNVFSKDNELDLRFKGFIDNDLYDDIKLTNNNITVTCVAAVAAGKEVDENPEASSSESRLTGSIEKVDSKLKNGFTFLKQYKTINYTVDTYWSYTLGGTCSENSITNEYTTFAAMSKMTITDNELKINDIALSLLSKPFYKYLHKNWVDYIDIRHVDTSTPARLEDATTEKDIFLKSKNYSYICKDVNKNTKSGTLTLDLYNNEKILYTNHLNIKNATRKRYQGAPSYKLNKETKFSAQRKIEINSLGNILVLKSGNGDFLANQNILNSKLHSLVTKEGRKYPIDIKGRELLYGNNLGFELMVENLIEDGLVIRGINSDNNDNWASKYIYSFCPVFKYNYNRICANEQFEFKSDKIQQKMPCVIMFYIKGDDINGAIFNVKNALIWAVSRTYIHYESDSFLQNDIIILANPYVIGLHNNKDYATSILFKSGTNKPSLNYDKLTLYYHGYEKYVRVALQVVATENYTIKCSCNKLVINPIIIPCNKTDHFINLEEYKDRISMVAYPKLFNKDGVIDNDKLNSYLKEKEFTPTIFLSGQKFSGVSIEDYNDKDNSFSKNGVPEWARPNIDSGDYKKDIQYFSDFVPLPFYEIIDK